MTLRGKWFLTPEEIGLLKQISRWRRTNGITFFQWRPGKGFGVLSEWKRFDDNGRQVNVSYEPDRDVPEDPRPRLVATRDYYRGAFAELPVRSIAEGVDTLVALGYLPARFSSAYRAGREAAYRGEPRHPEGTPEYETYLSELRIELAKFASGAAPYEYPEAS